MRCRAWFSKTTRRGIWMARHQQSFWLVCLTAFACLPISACEKRCAQGFGLVGNTCKPVVASAGASASSHDGGVDSPGDHTESSRTDSVKGGGGGGAATSAPAEAPKGNIAGTSGELSSSPSSEQAGAGGAGPSSTPSTSISGPGNATSTPAGPCVARKEGAVCDGAVLNHCDGAGNATKTETCMSDALCQIGSASGACAQCAPGAFSCDGVQLKECSSSGQWDDKEKCASEALCNDSAGACTDMVCMPGSTTCDASGNLLSCNADGSDFADRKACGVGLCDVKSGRCNKCMPSVLTCRGNSLVTCSADGQAESDETCAPKNECWTAACSGDTCRETPKAASARCEGSKYCNGSGDCVACTSDAHCSSMGDDCNDGTCQSGSCRRTPKTRGTACGAGLCDRGTCQDVECFSSSDCSGSGARCTDGECVACGDRKVGPGEQCDIGAPKESGDDLSSTAYDEFSCDARRCTRLYIFTPCTVETIDSISNQCGSKYRCYQNVCMPNAGCSTSGTSCTHDNGKSGHCYGNTCFVACSNTSECPAGTQCGELPNTGRVCING